MLIPSTANNFDMLDYVWYGSIFKLISDLKNGVTVTEQNEMLIIHSDIRTSEIISTSQDGQFPHPIHFPPVHNDALWSSLTHL
jgi:hypothetical protein